jgi:hypothetical protein
MRYISFVIAGDAPVTVRMSEQPNGSVLFNVDVDSSKGAIGDLRGLFFDVRDPSLLSHLSVSGSQVTDQQFGDEKVIDLGNGANMQGNPRGKFDVGIEFGTEGIGKDDIHSTSFVLTSSTGGLTLDDLALVDFGVRLTSVGALGGKRGDSTKTTELAPAAPDAIDDSVSAYEDTAKVFNLLSNDTDEDNLGQMIIVAVADPAHGTVVISADGKSVTYLADDDYSGPDSFTYSVSDQRGGGDTATAKVNVIAVADAPDLTVTTSAGTNVNDILVHVTSKVTDNDGSEFLDRFQFSGLPSGVTLTEQTAGVYNPAGEDQTLTKTFVLTLPIDADADFDLTVTAVAREKSNADEEATSKVVEVKLDAASFSFDETYDATDQSMWGSGQAFTFVDDRFLGIEVHEDEDTGGFIYGSASIDLKAGLQSTLTFQGGQIDASARYDIDIDTNYNRTTDVLRIDSSHSLTDASFSSFGPSGSYVLDFIFNYYVSASLGIDFEVKSFDLASFSFGSDNTINILDLNSEDIGLTYDLPYGLSVDLAWPTVNTTSSSAGGATFTSQGESNNFLQLNLDVDQALADIFLRGVNPFSVEIPSIGVAGGSADLIDLDLFGGLNFVQDFILSMGDLAGSIRFENGLVQAFDFSTLTLNNASSYDADGDNIVEFVLSLLPSATLGNSTDLGFNIGYSFDLLKASGWYDYLLDSGSWSEGPLYHAGGTLPLGSAEVYGSTFSLAFAADQTTFGV